MFIEATIEIIIAVGILMFLLGHMTGRRCANNRWCNRANTITTVRHRGKYYRVYTDLMQNEDLHDYTYYGAGEQI